MKAMIHALVVTIMCMLMQATAWCADQEWVGDWRFTECWPHISGEMNNCIFYEMTIRKDRKDSEVYDITINTNGYMAMQRLQARGFSQGAKLSIKFVNSAPDSVGPQYHQGDRLLTLKIDHSKTTTEWDEFKPELDDNIKLGIYFKKVK